MEGTRIYVPFGRTINGVAIASRENIDKRTVYKDLEACIADLTTLFFGIDGLEKR